MGNRIAIIFVVLVAGCATPSIIGGPDAMPDGFVPMVTVDAGTPDVDSGTDAGVDAAPPCACPSGPCCDACAPKATTVICAGDDMMFPDTCYPPAYPGGPSGYGYSAVRTYCGATGACDGAQVTLDHIWLCPALKVCHIRGGDYQAICY